MGSMAERREGEKACEMPDGPKGICHIHLRCVKEMGQVAQWEAFGGTFGTPAPGTECMGCYEEFEV